MVRRIAGTFAVVALWVGGYQPVAAQTASVDGQAVLKRYCLGCHSGRTPSAGLSLEHVDPTDPVADVETFEKILLKLQTGMMPPAGSLQPDADTRRSLIADLESRIDETYDAEPSPGRPVLHRLNRAEYGNAVRDLLGVEVDVEGLLPADDMSQGYDNMSDVLTVSPTLLESYLVAAGKISRMVMGDPDAMPSVDTYVVPQAVSQMRHVPGTPFGTRGGVAVRHHFPADGDYVFRLSFYFASIGALFGDNIPAEGEQIEIAVNGERVALLDMDRKLRTTDVLRTAPITIKAGPQMISAAFIQRSSGPVQDFVMPFDQALADLSTGHFPGLTGLPHLRNLGIDGPYDVTGVSDTASRVRLLTCQPSAPSDEAGRARDILSDLARRAFRRPLTVEDEVRISGFYERGRTDGTFETGVRLGVQAILADPEFLFRFERTPSNVAEGGLFSHH